MTGANVMETSTIRVAIRGINEPWDISRIPAVLDEIEAALREEADIPALLSADSMTIAIGVATDGCLTRRHSCGTSG